MKGALRLKSWAGPVTIGSFAVVGLSGILMFFHLNVGLVKLAHEWLGWLLVIGAIAHLVVNWRPFLGYFRKPAGLAIMAIFLVLGLLSFLPAGGPNRRPPFMAMSSALEKAPLTLVAQVAQSTPLAVTEHLKSHGIEVRDSAQTISQIAADNQKRSMEVLVCVFDQRDQSGQPGGPERGGH